MRSSQCTPWRHAAEITEESDLSDLVTVRVDPDGVVANMYFRDCGTTRQFVWVRDLDGEDLAGLAFGDLQSRLLVAPDVDVSPRPAVGGYVNLETWLAAQDPGLIDATATIPGLSATVTATVEGLRWDMGTTDGGIECDGLGVAWTPGTPAAARAPCGYTYRLASAPEYGGVAYQVTARFLFHARWQATDGTAGDLGTLVGPATTFDYTVREVQTIGERG